MEELMLFWWCAAFCTRLLMLFMMNLDSTVWNAVGIADRSSEQDCRWAMLKICVALIKEKGIRNSYQSSVEPISQRYNFFSFDGTTKSGDGTTFQVDQTTFQVHQTTFSIDRTTFQVDQTTKSVNGTTIIGCIVPDHIRLVKIVWKPKFCIALNKEKELFYLPDTLIKKAGICDFSKCLNCLVVIDFFF